MSIVEPAVDLAEVVDRDDVRVLQPRRAVGFAPEPGPEALVAGQVGLQDLQRHDPAADGLSKAR
jgi:hypothetical protein